MENTNVPVISAKDLNLWYGDFKALKGISLDVGEREITALIGPSGCGKSTFLKNPYYIIDINIFKGYFAYFCQRFYGFAILFTYCTQFLCI